MSKLEWDSTEDRRYSTGVDRGVCYPYRSGSYDVGKVWNGITKVTEQPTGAEVTSIYADNIKYLNLISAEQLDLNIEAYDYPVGCDQCFGGAQMAIGITIGQQSRRHFGFTFRTLNKRSSFGDADYDIHIIFNCLASPSEKSHSTVNDSPEASNVSVDVSTLPMTVSANKESSAMTLNRKNFSDVGLYNAFREIENILYGTDDIEPTCIKPSQIESIFSDARYLRDSSGDPIIGSDNEFLESAVYYGR